jgi:hypothetical protein
LWRNPGVEGSFEFVDLAQFVAGEWGDTVLRHEHAQLVFRVDRELVGAGLDQRGFCGRVLSEVSLLVQDSGIDLHKRQLAQGEFFTYEDARGFLLCWDA